MPQMWPPSPSVEDEEVSLAKEFTTGVSPHHLRSQNQPASSRGSVDQHPIILDSIPSFESTDTKDASGGQLNNVASNHVPSPQRHAPTIPHIVTNQEKRFVYIPSHTSDSDSETEKLSPPEPLQRSKSTTQIAGSEIPRGRPHVTRIHTDLGTGGPETMNTGRQRAPSPYAYKSPSMFEPLSAKPLSKDSMLSPMHAHQPRRPMSAHPGTRFADRESSDSDHKSKPKRRDGRSRSRAARESFSHSDRSEADRIRSSRSSARDNSRDSHFSRRARRYRSPAPVPGGFAGYTYTAQDRITPPQTPKSSSDPVLSSALDHSTVSDHTSNRYSVRRVTGDSPYTSSAEESLSRRHASGDERRVERAGRSRRNSRSYPEGESKRHLSRAPSQRRERVSKDEASCEPLSADERSHLEGHTPVSARSSLNMENFLQDAFIANQNKRPNPSANRSRAPSPLVSPTHSPPQTPRGDRTFKDYFEPPSYPAKASKHRSRQPSFDDAHFKDIRNLPSSLLSAATLGASLAAKAIPALSRSNTTSQSAETPSSGAQSRPGSGQRSRKPSPVTEEPQALAATISRANSVASRGDETMPIRTSTYVVNEDRPIPQVTQYAPPSLEPHRISSRAASYSYSPEQHRPAPPFRALSTASVPAFAQSLQFPTQQLPQASPVIEQGAMLPPSNPRPSGPPPCPRSKPVAGLHDWYTIRDMPFLDFCPTCMGFLGGSRFRDYFLPSLPRDPRWPISCAMSIPWYRYAWMQSIKQDRRDLSLLWQIASPPPPGTKPCAGSKVDVRRWYHLTDARTKKPVENFDICAACVRNIDLVFPKLQHRIFDRPQRKEEQDRICSFHPESRHFHPVLNELDRMAELDRTSDRRQKDFSRPRGYQDFVEFVRRLCRYRQCQKDTLLGIPVWHFIPDLAEFTICEECYYEVVWPIRDRPVARDVSKSLRILPPQPLRTDRLLQGTSCQLYSDRMRRVFMDAVNRNDFETLKAAAKYRYEMEHWLQGLQKLYEHDQAVGIDRRADMEKNITMWKAHE